MQRGISPLTVTLIRYIAYFIYRAPAAFLDFILCSFSHNVRARGVHCVKTGHVYACSTHNLVNLRHERVSHTEGSMSCVRPGLRAQALCDCSRLKRN